MIRRIVLLAAALMLAAVPALCRAQETSGQATAAWNPQTVRELEGTITAMGPAVSPVPGQEVQPPGALMMVLDTPQGPQQVLLGPGWYLYQQEPRLKLGDRVKVTGSVVTRNGASYVLAQKVVKDGQELTLRDESGRPVWAGGRFGRGAGAPMAPCPSKGMGRGGMPGRQLPPPQPPMGGVQSSP